MSKQLYSFKYKALTAADESSRGDGNTSVNLGVVSPYEDIYFNAVRITDSNQLVWKEFAEAIDNCKSFKRGEGIQGFLKSMRYYNNPETELWIMNVSDKKPTDADIIDNSSVEMIVTNTTSTDAFFSSHMGISRSPFYEGMKHPNLSIALHSFAANFMINLHPEKLYMITTPMDIMRVILMREFEERGLIDKIYVDHHSIKYMRLEDTYIELGYEEKPNTIEEAKDLYDKTQARVDDPNIRGPRLASAIMDRDNAGSYFWVLKQELRHKDTDYSPPITVSPLRSEDKLFFNDFAMIINDREGHPIKNFSPDERRGELKWFFEHPFQGIKEPVSLMVVDLQALRGLAEFEEIEATGVAAGVLDSVEL